MYEPHYDPEGHVLVFVDGPPRLQSYFAGPHHVFVCGALQHPDSMTPIIGRRASFAPAFTAGFARVTKDVDGRMIDFMVPQADRDHGILSGVLWLNLTAAEVERIDSVELAGGLREAIAIEVRVGDRRLHATSYIERRGVA